LLQWLAADCYLWVIWVISSAAFADDLLCPTGNLTNLKIRALKLTLYSDWASLIISGSKTKVTG